MSTVQTDDLDERIARIHKLLEAMRAVSHEAREEALIATEQLLTQSRRNYDDAMRQYRRSRETIKATTSKRRRSRP